MKIIQILLEKIFRILKIVIMGNRKMVLNFYNPLMYVVVLLYIILYIPYAIIEAVIKAFYNIYDLWCIEYGYWQKRNKK
jgi:hypothetical protein